MKLSDIHTLIVTTYANALVPTAGELVEKGWVPLIKAGIVGVNTSGQLEWLTTTSGQNSADSNTSTKSTLIEILNHNNERNAWLRGFGIDPSGDYYETDRADFDLTLAAGGTLTSTSVFAAIAAKTSYLEYAFFALSKAGDAAASSGIITVEDEDGNDMAKCAISQESGVAWIKFGGKTAAVNKAIHVAVSAGTVNLGASHLVGYVLVAHK